LHTKEHQSLDFRILDFGGVRLEYPESYLPGIGIYANFISVFKKIGENIMIVDIDVN